MWIELFNSNFLTLLCPQSATRLCRTMCCQAVMAVWSSAGTLPSETSTSTFALWTMKAVLRWTKWSMHVLFIWWVGTNKSHREYNTIYIQHSTCNSRHIFFSFFFPAKERTLKDSDLEKFKQQASCLGFSGEPDFEFDPKKGASLKTCVIKEYKQNVWYQSWFLSLSLSLQISVRKAKALT